MWKQLIQELPDVDVRTIQLPSSAPVPVAPLGDLYDDAWTIRNVVTDVGNPVVVCAHSYGGAPTSEGLAGVDLVKRLVYLNAWQLDVGESMLSNRGGVYPPHWGMHEDEGYVEMLGAEEVFYNDLDPGAAKSAAADLGPHSLKAFTQTLTGAAWHTIPSTYVIGEKDAAVPAVLRERYASRAGLVRRMDTSHSPFLSRRAETAALLREALATAT
jgi:pimeloyl-ACP methyl ester carboxylesterase